MQRTLAMRSAGHLMDIQLEYEVPVIHEVLLLENEQQAKVRCLGKDHNRGTEAAQTALAMAKVMGGLNWRLPSQNAFSSGLSGKSVSKGIVSPSRA